MKTIAAPTHMRRATYFGAMDGMRGILAICVAIYHTFWFTHINSTAFFNNGTVILDLFFVFSGFLMYTLYHKRLGTPDEAKIFLKRRFARLYPIHFFMLLVFVAFACVRLAAHYVGLSTQDPGEVLPFHAGSSDSFWNILAHLTMTHSMGVSDSLSFNPPSWTISVEFFTYFVFVLMYLRFPPKNAMHFGFITIGIGLIYLALSRVKWDMNITYDLGFWRCLAGFYAGIVTAWVFERINIKREGKAPLSVAVMTGIECLTLMAFILFTIYMPGKLQFFVAPFAFVFVLTIAFGRGWVSWFFARPVFLYLAKISYSVYMVHAIFAMVFYMFGTRLFPQIMAEGGFAGDLFLVPYLSVVIVTSHFTWTYIERPGQKWLEGLNLKRKSSKITV